MLGYFVTLFFPDLYTGPNIQIMGYRLQVEGLNEMLEASAGAGTRGPLTLHNRE